MKRAKGTPHRYYKSLQQSRERSSISGVSAKLQQKKIPAAEAYKHLSQLSPKHQIEAGRLAMELANRENDSNKATVWFEKAMTRFEQARIRSLHDKTALHLDALKASYLVSQLPAMSRLCFQGTLPDQSTATLTYHRLLETGYTVFEHRHQAATENPEVIKSLEWSEVVGLIAEIAVLSLGQRYALRSGITPETWFPMPASYSQDMLLNRRGSSINHAWDISVLTT